MCILEILFLTGVPASLSSLRNHDFYLEHRGKAVNTYIDLLFFYCCCQITTAHTKQLCGVSIYFAHTKHFKAVYIWHVLNAQLK